MTALSLVSRIELLEKQVQGLLALVGGAQIANEGISEVPSASTDLTYGKRLCKKRKLLKMSQDEMAHQLGTVRQSIQHWERGVMPPQSTRELILELYGVAEQTDSAVLFTQAYGFRVNTPATKRYAL
ncbi:MAG: helix-turn-helix transcriptional regulator [Agitococcus sp.]|nr:helix-turn-helix transcriptional regulator [Agitococcus sp.]